MKVFFNKRIFLLLAAVIFIMGMYHIYFQRVEIAKLNEENVTLEQVVNELKARKAKLLEDLKWENNMDSIEKKARNELRMIKPGELIYIIND